MFVFAYEARQADTPVKDANGGRILTTSYEVAATVARAHGAAVVCVGGGDPPYSGDVADAVAQDKRRAERAACQPTDSVPDGTESPAAAHTVPDGTERGSRPRRATSKKAPAAAAKATRTPRKKGARHA